MFKGKWSSQATCCLVQAICPKLRLETCLATATSLKVLMSKTIQNPSISHPTEPRAIRNVARTVLSIHMMTSWLWWRSTTTNSPIIWVWAEHIGQKECDVLNVLYLSSCRWNTSQIFHGKAFQTTHEESSKRWCAQLKYLSHVWSSH